MKREDLIKLGLAEDVVDKLMAMHGQDVERFKTASETAKTEADGFKKQLEDANKAIEGFKGMDIEGIKKAADEYKAQAEQAKKDAEVQVSQLKFDHALDGALTGAKAKNAKAVKALLDMNNLKLNEADGSIIGLEDQLKKVKESNDYLFEGENPPPKIVAGGNNQSVLSDPFMTAMRKGAGLSEGK